MTNPANYRYYNTIADMKNDTCAYAVGNLAHCDGYHAIGDGGGGWFHFEVEVTEGDNPVPLPEFDEGLTFEVTPTSWYRRITNEGHYNARWWGAKGDGDILGNDQPPLNAAATAAQADGIALYIPSGEYIVQPITDSNKIIEITAMNFRVFGDGADVTKIKIGAKSQRNNLSAAEQTAYGVSGTDYTDYNGFFVVDSANRDASGFHISDLTLDANYDDNELDGEEQLKMGFRRGGVEVRKGTGITVERCRFLDFPRQSLFIVSQNSTLAVCDVKVFHNECRTVTSATGAEDFDCTAMLLRADGLLIEGNRIIGNPSNYYLSRTAIQGTGDDVRVIGNEIVQFYRGIIVGSGEGEAKITSGITVIGNTMRDVNGGIEINVQAGQSDTSEELNGYAMRNCIVQGNSIHLNKLSPSNPSGFAIDSSDKLLHGILLRTGTDTDVAGQNTGTGHYAVDGLRITDNQIYNVPSDTPEDLDAGSGLIELNCALVKLALTTPNRNWTISNNTLFSPPRRGITLMPRGIHNMTVSNNTIVDVGQRSLPNDNPGTELSHRCGIRYVGGSENPVYTVVRDEDGDPILLDGKAQISVSSTLPQTDSAVRINGNHIIDRRTTARTVAGVVLINFARGDGCDDIECLDNHVVLADDSDIPIVETTSLNMTPFIRAHTGKMSFELPTEACRYGSTVVDEIAGKTRIQATAPSGTDWKEAAALV